VRRDVLPRLLEGLDEIARLLLESEAHRLVYQCPVGEIPVLEARPGVVSKR
jgi:hypothetical protein